MAFPLVDLSPTTTQYSLEPAPSHHQGLPQHQGHGRRRRPARRRAKNWLGVSGQLTGRNRNRIGDQRTNHDHTNHGDDEYAVRDFFKAMHSTQASGAKGPVRKQTRNQKQQCVGGQEIVCQRVGGSKCDNDADQSDNGQANADHCGRDSEDVNANVLLQVAGCAAPRLLFSFHTGQYLDWSRKRLFRQLRAPHSFACACSCACSSSCSFWRDETAIRS